MKKREPFYTIRNLAGDEVFTAYLLAPWFYRLFGLTMELHVFPPLAEDSPECFHTHPFHARRRLLSGFYVEEVYQSGRKRRKEAPDYRFIRKGDQDVVGPDHCHRIKAVGPQGATSLWLHGNKDRQAILLKGTGWPAGTNRIIKPEEQADEGH